MDKAAFAEHVDDAYRHLYDLVYLRSQPLIDIIVPDASLALKERAWQLHNLLLEAIGELEPNPPASVRSRPWRRHQLMVLRYRRGLEPEVVAEQLGIGVRHYYREHKTAMDALAETLWNRYFVQPAAEPTAPASPAERQATLSGMELLRLEVARLAQADRYTPLGGVLDRALALLADELHRRGASVQVALPPSLPGVSVNESLLRQIVLQVLGYLAERSQVVIIHVDASVGCGLVWMTMRAEPGHAVDQEHAQQEQLDALEEMASAASIQAAPVRHGSAVVGFRLGLPIAERTVLAIDDNEDALQLVRRFLAAHDYPVVTAQSAEEGFELARSLKPYAILLDLMMPDRDGWDLLQTLLAHPETAAIPIIVCTVLKQRELALSLGATVFLTKPVTERELTGALSALRAP